MNDSVKEEINLKGRTSLKDFLKLLIKVYGQEAVEKEVTKEN